MANTTYKKHTPGLRGRSQKRYSIMIDRELIPHMDMLKNKTRYINQLIMEDIEKKRRKDLLANKK